MGLGGEIHDDVRLGNPFVQLLSVTKVTLDESDLRLPVKVAQVVSVARVGQLVVDDQIPIGMLPSPIAGEVAPDEACAARDQNRRHPLSPHLFLTSLKVGTTCQANQIAHSFPSSSSTPLSDAFQH